MADEIDRSQERQAAFNDSAIRAVRDIPFVVGEPGECQECGEHSPRLVGGICAFCRDGR